MSSSAVAANCWPDSQRTNGSVSCAARKRNRSGDSPDSFTGAENSRSSDGTGGLATSTNSKRFSACGRQQNASALDRVRFSVQPRREFLAIAVQQTHGNRV